MTNEELSRIMAQIPQGLDANEFLRQLILASMREERQACKKIAEDYVKGFDREYAEVGQEIAGLIEERGS